MMTWEKRLDQLEREAKRICVRRTPPPTRAPNGEVSLVSDCSGQGSFPQALGHLGLKVHLMICTELDPNKRDLLKIVHQLTGCCVDKVLADVYHGCAMFM